VDPVRDPVVDPVVDPARAVAGVVIKVVLSGLEDFVCAPGVEKRSRTSRE
jgi:hypothetical protein